jgi:DNA-binding response OmpR family regulator
MEQTSVQPTSSSEAPRIVVAEDNHLMAQVIGFNLKHAGFQVVVTKNGGEAWAEIEKGGASLLVTDFQMPVMNGGELCRRVREHYQSSELPIILLSAKGLESNATDLRDDNLVQEIVFKPFSPRQLVITISDCLRKAREQAGASV